MEEAGLDLAGGDLGVGGHRRVEVDGTGVPARNGVEVLDIAPAADDLIAVTVAEGGRHHTLCTRKVVLATGQEGAGRWWMPDFVAALPAHLRAHAADAIDFPALRGKTVAVLGAGASAFDNAAVALEHGAAAVHLFCRRVEPQTIQPFRWLTFAGFLRHFSELDATHLTFAVALMNALNRIAVGMRRGPAVKK